MVPSPYFHANYQYLQKETQTEKENGNYREIFASYNLGHNILKIFCVSIVIWFIQSKTGIDFWYN